MIVQTVRLGNGQNCGVDQQKICYYWNRSCNAHLEIPYSLTIVCYPTYSCLGGHPHFLMIWDFSESLSNKISAGNGNEKANNWEEGNLESVLEWSLAIFSLVAAESCFDSRQGDFLVDSSGVNWASFLLQILLRFFEWPFVVPHHTTWKRLGRRQTLNLMGSWDFWVSKQEKIRKQMNSSTTPCSSSKPSINDDNSN